MVKITEKLVKNIIDKHINVFGENITPPNHIIADKKYYFDDIKAPASLIGPIDGQYGLYLNVRDYIFDEKNILIPIILHEMVHYKLLLDGKQSNENQHDENFQELAEKIEKTTGIDGIKYGMNYVHRFLRYKNKTFYPLLIENINGKFITRINRNKIKYWEKYLKESVTLGEIKKFKIGFATNREIFESIPLTNNVGHLNCVPYDDEILSLDF